MCLETDKIRMSTYKNHASHEEASLEMKGNFLKVSWPLARGVSFKSSCLSSAREYDKLESSLKLTAGTVTNWRCKMQ